MSDIKGRIKRIEGMLAIAKDYEEIKELHERHRQLYPSATPKDILEFAKMWKSIDDLRETIEFVESVRDIPEENE